jgi:hypothetical protein
MVLHIATAARQRLANEHNGRAWLAWHITALPKQKRLPRLDTLTIKRQRTRDQTWQQQMQVCRMIAAAYGRKPVNG